MGSQTLTFAYVFSLLVFLSHPGDPKRGFEGPDCIRFHKNVILRHVLLKYTTVRIIQFLYGFGNNPPPLLWAWTICSPHRVVQILIWVLPFGLRVVLVRLIVPAGLPKSMAAPFLLHTSTFCQYWNPCPRLLFLSGPVLANKTSQTDARKVAKTMHKVAISLHSQAFEFLWTVSTSTCNIACREWAPNEMS